MRRLVILLLTLFCCGTLAQAQSVPSSMQFQGRLTKPDGTPVPDTNSQLLTFRLYDALTGGNHLWQRTLTNISVRNGAFATRLDFSAGYLNGHTFASVFGNGLLKPFLEIQIANEMPLAPRQPLTSVPYAFTSGNALTVPDGSITANKFAPDLFNPLAWLLGGNSGTNPASHFLGTKDNHPLVFRTNNIERMRLLPGGSLGVGSSAPTALLQVGSDQDFGNVTTLGLAQRSSDLVGLSIRKSGNGNPVIQMISSTGASYIETDRGSDLMLGTDGHGGNAAVRIRADGTIGMPFTSTNARLLVHANGLEFAGFFNGSCLASIFLLNSDARFKKDVTPLTDSLAAILSLQGVSYAWRQDIPGQSFSKDRQIGFIAQEVEKVLPELVHTASDGYKSVAYQNLAPVLVEAIKTQQKQMDTLRRENGDKQEQMERLAKKNAELEARLNALTEAFAELKAGRSQQ